MIADSDNQSMVVRGKAILSIVKFVKKKFGEEGFILWMNRITPEAREVYSKKILPNRWYPLKKIMIEPTANIAHLFYNWNLKAAAWEFGRFSADLRFKGLLKILVKFPSTKFFINKGTEYLPDYYQPCKLEVPQNIAGSAIVRITYFPEIDKTTEFRIGGWIERGLEITGCKNVKVEVSKALTNFDPYTEYQISWLSRTSK